MVSYVTRNQLLAIAKDDLRANRARVSEAQRRAPAGSTFLSHASSDNNVMPAVVTILENHGTSVYLDSNDPDLANSPPRETATRLRTIINECKKLVVFVSKDTKASRWVPWELGLGDGFKTSSNVAIFPAPENNFDTEWTEQEYLGIYDRIVWGCLKGQNTNKWLVWNQSKNTAVLLREWLQR